MKFLSLSILALVIALPVSSVCGEVEIPQELQDLLKDRDGLVKEESRLRDAVGKIRKELADLKSRDNNDYHNGSGVQLKKKYSALYRQIAQLSKQIRNTDKAIHAEIIKPSQLRRDMIARHEHRMTPELFLLSREVIKRELQLGPYLEQLIVMDEIDQRIKDSVLIQNIRSENLKVLRTTLEFICNNASGRTRDDSCSDRINKILEDVE